MKKLRILFSIACVFFLALAVACGAQKSTEDSSLNQDAPSYEYVYRDDDFLKGYEIAHMQGDFSENGVLTIPDSYMGEPIVSIGISWAHSENDPGEFHPSITKVVIPASVKNIRRYAFLGMKNLQEVEFTEGSQLESVRAYAFKNCSSLNTIALPEGTKYIEGNAFENCVALTVFSLPTTLIDVNALVFTGCTALQNIQANGENFVGLDGVLYNKEINELICYPLGKKDKTYRVEERTVEIVGYAFYVNPWLESITMENVSMLRHYAFAGCAKLSVVTADSLNFMEEEALSGTAWWEERQKETRVTLGNVFVKYRGTEENISINGMSIAPYAFKGNTTLKEVTLCVRTVMDEAFMDCTALERVYIHRNAPTDIVYIGLRVFDNNAENRKIIIPHESSLAKYNANNLWQPYIDSFEVAEETNE